MSVTKDEVSGLITLNNQQMMDSFKVLLQDTVGQIKRANEDAADLQMREIKKLKHSEPHKFKRKANEDQYKFNLKLRETLVNAKSAAQKSQLEKVKSELEEGEKLLLERQKHILLLINRSQVGFLWKNTRSMIWRKILTTRSAFSVPSGVLERLCRR